MGHEMQDIIPASGMDADSDDRKIEPGSYRYALNFRNGTGYIGREGAGTNTKGNVDIPTYFCPYNGGTFPEGKNKTIGSFEDTIHNTVIFLNWNSKGKHGIYRWYPNKSDANNPNGVVEQIIQYDFRWKQKERITSINYVPATTGDLLYWNDSTGLRKINIDRANINGKPKSWNIYFPKTNPFTVNGQFLIISIKDYNGNYLSGMPFQIQLQSHTSTEDGIRFIAEYINDLKNWNITPSIVAEACSCHLKITEIGTSAFTYEVSSSFINPIPSIIVPDNWYGSTDRLTDRMFDWSMYMPLTAPQMEYKKDPQTLFNNVKNLVFQSRLAYTYQDFETSAPGVVSQIAINNIDCAGFVNEDYNYIDINFNDPELFVDSTLAILKQVIVLIRKGNGDNWEKIISLDPCDFLDYANSTWFCNYKFYNDVAGTVVSNEAISKTNGGVPIHADASVFNKDRVVLGGVTKGRTAPDCVEGDYKITIEDSVEQLYDVTVHVRIYNPKADGNSAPEPFPSIGIRDRVGAIYQFSASAPEAERYSWGGVGLPGTQIGDGILTDDGVNKYQQYVPSGGFIGYLAGTDYLGISRQIQIKGGKEGTYLPTVNEAGVIDCIGILSTNPFLDLQNFMVQSSLPDGDPNKTDLYQRITIKNVPKGKYVFRLASHWCSDGDLLGKGSNIYDLSKGQNYQRTSTNVFCITPIINGAFSFNRRESEISFEVKGTETSPIFLGDMLVYDVCNITTPGNADKQKRAVFDGYLYDANGSAAVSELKDKGIAMEKQWVSLYGQGKKEGTSGLATYYISTFYTDHNGHFYTWCDSAYWSNTAEVSYAFSAFGFRQNSPSTYEQYATQLDTYYVSDGNSVLNDLSTQSLKPQDIKSETYVENDVTYNQVLVANRSVSATNSMKTFLNGRVENSSGEGVRNVLVVLENNGRQIQTDINGNYKIAIWADSKGTDSEPVFTISALQPVSGGASFTGGPITSFQPINSFNRNQYSGRRFDKLLFNNYICPATLSQDRVSLNIIGALGDAINANPTVQIGRIAPYSPTSQYLVQNIVITMMANTLGKARKRGGHYIDCIRYYDLQGRVCSCVEIFRPYIPYETENLKNFPYVLNPATNLPYSTDTYLSGRPVIQWSIPAEAPEYAAFYQLMRSQNTFQGRYLQWVANGAQYLSQVATSANAEKETSFAIGDAVAIKISLQNIVTYQGSNPTSQVGYTYNAGDRVRFIRDRDGNLLQGIYDYEIASFDAQTSSIIVACKNIPFEVKSGFTIEVYQPTPAKPDQSQVIYEVGEVYRCITDPNTGKKVHSVTSGTYTNGDTYWRGSRIPVLDSTGGFAAVYPINTESASVSNFYASQAEDIGRLGLIDPNFRELYYPSSLMVSDAFLPDTAANGLSSFNPLNTKDLGKQYGSVSRLLMNGKILYAIMNNTQVSSYIGILTLQYAQSQSGIQVQSDDYLGTQNPSISYLGTDLPATVAVKDGYIYGLMSVRSSCWRFANDGFKEISRNDFQDQNGNYRTRMVNAFKELCADGIWDANAVYDRRYNEYILTVIKTATANGIKFSSINEQGKEKGDRGTITQIIRFNQALNILADDVVSVSYTNSETGKKVTHDVTITKVTTSPETPSAPARTDIYFTSPEGDIQLGANVVIKYAGASKTIAWNEEKNRWTTEYSFVPECYSAHGDELVSFKSGRVWLHDKNNVRNNFYGVQSNLVVTPVFNQAPLLTKVWNAMWMLMFQDNKKNNWFSNLIRNQAGQLSRLKAANFVKREEGWYADFKRDITDNTVANPITEGRVLRSTALEARMENDHTGEVVLMGWRINWTLSERTQK